MATQNLTPVDAFEKIFRLSRRARGSRPLPFYWDVGKVVLAGDGGYGSNTRKKIADLLKSAGVDGLQIENLAKAAKFAEIFPDRSTASKLEQCGVGWRAAAMLCSSYVSHVRDNLVDRLVERKIDPRELGAIVRRMSGEKAVANDRSILAAAARATKDVKSIIKLLLSPRVDDGLKSTGRTALQKLGRLIEEHAG